MKLGKVLCYIIMGRESGPGKLKVNDAYLQPPFTSYHKFLQVIHRNVFFWLVQRPVSL